LARRNNATTVISMQKPPTIFLALLIFTSIATYFPAYGPNSLTDHEDSFLPEVQAQSTFQPSTLGVMHDYGKLVQHSSANYTLYNRAVALNIVWDGTYAYCRILNNTATEPWKAYPISYWSMWHFEFLGAGGKWREDVPLQADQVSFSNAVQNMSGAFLTETLTLPSLGSTAQISYKLLTDGKLKWDIKFTAGAAKEYRLRYRMDTIPSQHVKVDVAKQIVFTYSPSFNLTFFYDDVNQALYPCSEIYDEGNHKFYFDISLRTLSAGQSVSIDPSTVASTSASYPTGSSHQRKCFYANGRYWVFYSDGTNMVYKSSTDGASWSDPTSEVAADQGDRFSVWFDGTYVHYVTNCPAARKYRRGTPNSDGTITWSQSQQNCYGDFDAQVAVDTNTYPWFTYIQTVANYLYVRKSNTNDGTWNTQSGFPYYPGRGDVNRMIAIIPLTNQRTYLFYPIGSSSLVYGQLWTGSWGGEEAITGNNPATSTYSFSAVNYGDDVHIVYDAVTSRNIIHHKRTYGSGWGGGTTVRTGGGDRGISLTVNTANGDLYVFYTSDSTKLQYRKYTASTSSWGTSDIDLFTGRVNVLYPVAFYMVQNNKIGIIWQEGNSSPYTIIFGLLTLNTAPTNDQLSLDLAGASYKGAKTLLCAKQDYKFVYKCSDIDGVTTISYAQIQLDPTGKNVILRATRGSGDLWTFSEQSDPSNYVTLNTGGSSHSTSGNQKTFNFLVTINWAWGDSGETVTVRSYVIDSESASDQDDYGNIFGVEAHLASSSLAVNDYRCNPSQTLTFSGYWYYDGTSIYPPNGNYAVLVKLSGVQKGSTDTTLVSGAFSISDVTAESTLGSYSYTVEATYMASSGSFSTVKVDRVEFWQWGTMDSDKLVNKGDAARICVKVRYDLDDTEFTSGTLSINGTSATYSANGYWYADIAVSSVSNKTFAVSSFTDSAYGLTTSVETGSKVYVQWTELTATLSAVDGSTGTYQTLVNVTLTWAHNSTAVNSPTVYVWDGSACIGEAVGNGTGFASITTNATIHGSGTLSINGTKSSINVNTPLSLSYSITVSGLQVQPQSSYTSGQPGSVTVNFKNEAVLNAVDLKLENVSLRWRVVIGEVQFCSYTLAIDDLAATSWRNQTYSITITGVPQTGVYTLRTELVQLGSEWLVASTGKSVYITLPGGSPVGVGPTAGGLKLSILGGAFETPTGKTTLIEVPVSLQGADVLELTDVSVNATWVQLNQTLPIQLNAGASKLRFMVTPPTEGVYTCLIAVKGKSGGQTVTTAGYFTLNTYAALPTPSGPAAQWILLGLAGLVGGVFLVGSRRRKREY